MIVERSFSFFFFIQHKLGYRNGGGEEGGGGGFARINTKGEEKWRLERGIEIGKKAGDAAQCSARVRK